MTDLVFFYGTLMSGFQRPGRARLDRVLTPVARGWIHAALFDLGIYPAAVPASDSRVWGEVHRMLDSDSVLATLDEIEGFSISEPDKSLYLREEIPVMFDDGRVAATLLLEAIGGREFDEPVWMPNPRFVPRESSAAA